MWGKPIRVARRMAQERITPTCVGKASFEMTDLFAGQDHPPLVWGKLPTRFLRKTASRITPTCVGKAMALA